MQVSAPRKCPDCDEGKKSDKLCLICRGTGMVRLVPAMRLPYGKLQGWCARELLKRRPFTHESDRAW